MIERSEIMPADTELLEATLERVFSHHGTPEARQRAEASGWMPSLWDALHGNGLTSIGTPESAGGAGGTAHDAAAVLRLAGKHAAALPLAETSGLLGGWMVAAAGLSLPEGPFTVPLPRAGDSLRLDGGMVTGTLARVPWSAQVGAVVAVALSDDGPVVVVLDPRDAVRTPGHDLAGQPRDQLVFDAARVPAERIGAAPAGLQEELVLRGALCRTLLMAGALETVATLTVAYTGERQQFGRPIGKFQAVAQRLARLASEAEAVSLAAEVALRRLVVAGSDARFEVAAAKATAGRAASEVTAASHQIHGAIGMSQEYQLHHFTRRLWTWRQEWGSETYWSYVLGQDVAAAGPDALWPRLSTGIRRSA
jgi:acyl-CoA dehydrogenase